MGQVCEKNSRTLYTHLLVPFESDHARSRDGIFNLCTHGDHATVPMVTLYTWCDVV